MILEEQLAMTSQDRGTLSELRRLYEEQLVEIPETWQYTMRRDMQEILPGLYLGPYNSASKSKFHSLLNQGITHIICIRQSNEAHIIKPNFPDKFIYLTVDMADTVTQNIIHLIAKCKDFIDQCLGSGGKCLVHSYLGVSRSPVIVAAYVMGKKSLTYLEAMEYVKTRRYCIYPNEHFLQQLKEYEAIYRAEQTAQQGQCSQEKGNLKRKHDEGDESRFAQLNEPMDQMT